MLITQGQINSGNFPERVFALLNMESSQIVLSFSDRVTGQVWYN